jgi:hypothetical protein
MRIRLLSLLRPARTAVVVLSLLLSSMAVGSLHAQKPRGDRNRLTSTELAEAPATATNAYDIIRAARPQWLTPPIGRTSSSNVMGDGGGAKDIVLYIDDTKQPSLDDLRTIKSATIVEMRFLDQNRALQLRGPGHEMGVIEVTTISGKKK